MTIYVGANNIISPLGFTTKQNLVALMQAKSGIKQYLFPFSDTAFHCSKIEDDILNEHFQPLVNGNSYTRLEKMCILSIQDILQQSGVGLQNKETLLVLSTTKGNIDILENTYPDIPSERAYLPAFSKSIANYFHCVNTPLVVSNACISGLLAIIVAKRLIENGTYKNVLVCGADIISEFTLSGFKSFNALSNGVCKPFDKNRSGINLGEAASAILLSADNIGDVKIVAGSSANDANHISGPSRTGEGLFQAINNTLNTVEAPSIDFISAHGTATEYNDEMESIAFTRAGLQYSPLNSLKGYYGHTLGAAGVLETVVSVEALLTDTLIRSIGYEQAGTTQLLNIIQTNKITPLNGFLKTASGFGGCNAAVLFEKIK